MHVHESNQHDVQVSRSATLGRSNALLESDSMAGIRWTFGLTRKPSCLAKHWRGTPNPRGR
jgi:hypothetical protein